MDKLRKILIIVALAVAIAVGSSYLYGKYEPPYNGGDIPKKLEFIP